MCNSLVPTGLQGQIEHVTPASQQQEFQWTIHQTVSVEELSAEEIQEAQQNWLVRAQEEMYSSPIATLKVGKQLPPQDLLRKLCPALKREEPRLLIIQGRLDSTELPLTMRCPIILPQKHRVTDLIVAAADKKCGHEFGSSYVLSQLADRYWLVRGKCAAKKYHSECKGCRLRHAKPTQQLMGWLPAPCVQYGQTACSNVGVDNAGSFFTKQGVVRPRKSDTSVFLHV